MLSTQHEENPMPPLIISSREDLEHQLVTLYAQGLNIRALSRHFCLGRNTVRRILRKHKARREYGQDAKDHLFPGQASLIPIYLGSGPFWMSFQTSPVSASLKSCGPKAIWEESPS